jgi:predicted DNA-binding protein
VVSNQPKTPIRGFRIPSDLYHAAMAKAESEGRTLTDVVREALQRYVDSE